MKLGTIVENPWAGDKNPSKRGVYIGNNKTLHYINGRFVQCEYDKKIFKQFKILGLCDEYEAFKSALKKLVGD